MSNNFDATFSQLSSLLSNSSNTSNSDNQQIDINSLLSKASALFENNNAKSPASSFPFDNANILGMLSSLTNAPTRSNSTETDSRIALLDAITPFLRDENKEKVQTCKQMLRLASLSNLFGDLR